MGGRSVHNDPIVLNITDQAHVMLESVGWLPYQEKLQGFHTEITLEFMKNL